MAKPSHRHKAHQASRTTNRKTIGPWIVLSIICTWTGGCATAPIAPHNAPTEITESTPAADPAPVDADSSARESYPIVSESEEGSLDSGVIFGPGSETVSQTLKADVRSTLNRENAIILGLATIGSLVAREELDDRVRRYTARHVQSHERQYGDLHDVLDSFGHPGYQWPVIVGVYGIARMTDDEYLQSAGGAAMSALGLTTASTFALKGIVNTKRPSDEVFGGNLGFPSYHTSSSFALAAVSDEYYGPLVGLPAYGLAGLIGWSRIDERDHDLSDVIFGAALGYVIGKSVARRHHDRDHSVRLLPYVYAPSSTAGLSVEARF